MKLLIISAGPGMEEVRSKHGHAIDWISSIIYSFDIKIDVKTTLKASINELQDLDYSIDVLNSDVGIITASRTTE